MLLTPAQRTYCMSRIKGKDTQPELLVRRFLHAAGLRFRLHAAKLPGKPDLVLRKYWTVIFVNGCFWHAHEGCPKAAVPQTRVEFWTKKLAGNKARDGVNHAALRAQGWRVLVVWTCELTARKREARLAQLLEEIINDHEPNA